MRYCRDNLGRKVNLYLIGALVFLNSSLSSMAGGLTLKGVVSEYNGPGELIKTNHFEFSTLSNLWSLTLSNQTRYFNTATSNFTSHEVLTHLGTDGTNIYCTCILPTLSEKNETITGYRGSIVPETIPKSPHFTFGLWLMLGSSTYLNAHLTNNYIYFPPPWSYPLSEGQCLYSIKRSDQHPYLPTQIELYQLDTPFEIDLQSSTNQIGASVIGAFSAVLHTNYFGRQLPLEFNMVQYKTPGVKDSTGYRADVVVYEIAPCTKTDFVPAISKPIRVDDYRFANLMNDVKYIIYKQKERRWFTDTNNNTLKRYVKNAELRQEAFTGPVTKIWWSHYLFLTLLALILLMPILYSIFRKKA